MTPDPAYRTRREHLQLDAATRLHYDRVTNADELVDALLAKGDDHEDVRDDRLPYWADPWHSALALARHVWTDPLICPGTRVTELGCGLALPGIATALRGADVLLTDYLPEALNFARRNAAFNTAAPIRYLQLDWRRPQPAARADLILAADVAYESRYFPVLEQCFRQLLLPGGRVLLTEPGRGIAAEWTDGLTNAGFTVTRSEHPVTLDGATRLVRLHELRI
ncbi:MAG: methyltransferase domain-containing protein [Saprospiraceae bacterium]